MFNRNQYSSLFFTYPVRFIPMDPQEKLEFFLSGIKQRSLSLIMDYLKADPYLVLAKDKNGDTPLHVALRSDYPEIVGMILDKIKLFPQAKEMLMHANNQGATPLHVAAKYGNYSSFQQLVDALGADANNAAKRVNKGGHLPLTLLRYNKKLRQRKAIRPILEDLTIKDINVKGIKQSLDFLDIKSSHQNDINAYPGYEEELHYAYIAMSYARKIVDGSSTHPYINNLDDQERNNLIFECSSPRLQYHIKKLTINASDYANHDDYVFAKLQAAVDPIKQTRRAKCQEYAYLVLYALIKMGIKIPARIGSIKNGDHVFVILGSGWQSIIIDAWSGEAYPAYKMHQKLNSYKWYSSRDNNHAAALVYPFDGAYQDITIQNSTKFSDQFFQNNNAIDLDEFEMEEKLEILAHINTYAKNSSLPPTNSNSMQPPIKP